MSIDKSVYDIHRQIQCHAKDEMVTPETAREWLASSPGNPRWVDANKVVNRRRVEFFKTHIANGTFYYTGCIELDDQGRLADGHHRLTAIAESGVPQWMCVKRNVPRQYFPDIDLHSRGESDHGKYLGMDWYTNHAVAAAKVMRSGLQLTGSHGKLDTIQALAFAKRHKDALVFGTQLFSNTRRGITIAPVMGLVARAYYHVDHDVLREFADVLCTGISTKPEHSVIIKLRDKLLYFALNQHNGGIAQAKKYAYALRALQAFVRGKHLGRLCQASSDSFTLPE